MTKEEFVKQKKLLYKLCKKSRYPLTAKLLLRFLEKIDEISSVVKTLEDKAKIYPCMILIRSQIEHLMIVYYVWMKNRIDKDDKAAEDYFSIYIASELLKRENYKISIKKISDNSINESMLDKLIAYDKELKNLDDEIIAEIHKNAYQFKIRRITNFIVNETPDGDKFALKDKMIKFLNVYNLISSFTHGGPTADSLFYNDLKGVDFSKMLDEYKSWSSRIIGFMTFIIFWFFIGIEEKNKK